MSFTLRGWYKGADTTSLLYYLEDRFGREVAEVDDDEKEYFNDIHTMIVSANQFMKTLYHAALYLTCRERDVLIQAGRLVMTLFKKVANFAFHRSLCRFKLQPKFHLLGEMVYELEEDKKNKWESISPLSYSTQMDEDFIGHISISSRYVNIRTLHERTIGRYKVALAMHWG